jgi:hypothetical protein
MERLKTEGGRQKAESSRRLIAARATFTTDSFSVLTAFCLLPSVNYE